VRRLTPSGSYLALAPQNQGALLTNENGIDCCCPTPPECFLKMEPCSCGQDDNRYTSCSHFEAAAKGQSCIVVNIATSGDPDCYTVCNAPVFTELPPGALFTTISATNVRPNCAECCDPRCWHPLEACHITGCSNGATSLCSSVPSGQFFVACEDVPPEFCPDGIMKANGTCWRVNCDVSTATLPNNAIALVPTAWYETCQECCCPEHCNNNHHTFCLQSCNATLNVQVVGMNTTATECTSGQNGAFFNPTTASGIFQRATTGCLWVGNVGVNCSGFTPCPPYACIPPPTELLSKIQCGSHPVTFQPGWVANVWVRMRTVENSNCFTCCTREFVFFNSGNIGGCPPPGGWQSIGGGPVEQACGGTPMLVVG